MIFRRRSALVLASLSVLSACSDSISDPLADHQAVAPGQMAPLRAAAANGVEDSYIVVLKEGADPRAVAAIAKVEPTFVYEAALNGFAATLNKGQLTALQHNKNVEYIEQDQFAVGEGTQTMDSGGNPWGLDRSDQRYLSLSKSYSYGNTGAGVYVYILDTGIQAGHPEFEGRARSVYDAFGGNGADCHGHGTHVAGTIGAKTYGVAKKVYLRSLRVLNCNNYGQYSAIIAGLDWVRKNRANPAVANISMAGGYSSSLNYAVTNLVNSGVFVAVAAGNSGKDACQMSPASTPAAFTAAASDKYDYRASWSNYGKCVDSYAPGVKIKSTWLDSTVRSMSGTSTAAPHIAGVAALYKGKYGNVSSSTIDSWLKSNGTTGVIKSNPSGTPNRLLYKSTL